MKTYILLLIWIKLTNNSIKYIYYTAKVDTRFPILTQWYCKNEKLLLEKS